MGKKDNSLIIAGGLAAAGIGAAFLLSNSEIALPVQFPDLSGLFSGIQFPSGLFGGSGGGGITEALSSLGSAFSVADLGTPGPGTSIEDLTAPILGLNFSPLNPLDPFGVGDNVKGAGEGFLSSVKEAGTGIIDSVRTIQKSVGGVAKEFQTTFNTGQQVGSLTAFNAGVGFLLGGPIGASIAGLGTFGITNIAARKGEQDALSGQPEPNILVRLAAAPAAALFSAFPFLTTASQTFTNQLARPFGQVTVDPRGNPLPRSASLFVPQNSATNNLAPPVPASFEINFPQLSPQSQPEVRRSSGSSNAGKVDPRNTSFLAPPKKLSPNEIQQVARNAIIPKSVRNPIFGGIV